MGTFGTGIFENDSAMDWIAEFSEKKSLKALEKILAKFEASPESCDGEIVLACCEIVAAIGGFSSDELDPDIEEWADKQRVKVSETLRNRAIAAAQSITTDSEIAELWKESESNQAWLEVQHDLLNRLNQTPLAAGTPKPRRPPTVEIVGSAAAADPKRFRIGEKLPDLSAEIPGLGTATRVTIKLAQQLTVEEARQVACWMKADPELQLVLSDYKKPKSYRLDLEVLKCFAERRELLLHLESLRSVDFLSSFHGLEKLELRFVRATDTFTALAALPKLTHLELYECDSSAFDDFSQLAEFRALQSLVIRYIRTLSLAEGAAIQTKLELASLPELPESFRALTLSCVSISDIRSVQTLSELQTLDIFGMRCETPTLDLRACLKLRRLEFVSIQGLRTVHCPPALTSLQLQNVYGMSAELPSTVATIKLLRVSVASLNDAIQDFHHWDGLRALVVTGADAFTFLERFCCAPQLSYLQIEAAQGPARSFSNFPEMRFFAAFEFDGDPSLLRELGTCKKLSEFSLVYSFDGAITPAVDHFRPLQEVADLRAMAITACGFEEAVRTGVSQMLGVKIANWFAQSETDLFLRELEAVL